MAEVDEKTRASLMRRRNVIDAERMCGLDRTDELAELAHIEQQLKDYAELLKALEWLKERDRLMISISPGRVTVYADGIAYIEGSPLGSGPNLVAAVKDAKESR